jgi:hypothetical protein
MLVSSKSVANAYAPPFDVAQFPNIVATGHQEKAALKR